MFYCLKLILLEVAGRVVDGYIRPITIRRGRKTDISGALCNCYKNPYTNYLG